VNRVIDFRSESFPEVRESSLTGDMCSNTSIGSIRFSFIKVSESVTELSSRGKLINDPEKVKEEDRTRVIAGRAEDRIFVSDETSDKRPIKQGREQS
jgi:hypothetical protein